MADVPVRLAPALQELTVTIKRQGLGEISWVLCDHLEGWDREGGRETQEGGDICIGIADSLCYKAETNTPL